MKKFVAVLSLLFTLPQAVYAEDFLEKETPKRFTIETGIGLNLFLPFVQVKLGYRLPTEENRWEIHFTQSYNAAIGTPLNISSIGTKYYFADNKAEFLHFQSFLGAELGVGYSYFDSKVTGSNPSTSISEKTILSGFLLNIGVGTDLNVIDNLKVSAAAYFGYPMIFRPEINIKI